MKCLVKEKSSKKIRFKCQLYWQRMEAERLGNNFFQKSEMPLTGNLLPKEIRFMLVLMQMEGARLAFWVQTFQWPLNHPPPLFTLFTK